MAALDDSSSAVSGAQAACAVRPQDAAAAPAMSGAEWTMLLALSVIWGASFFFMKVAVQEVSFLVVVASRIALGALFLWGVVLVRRITVPRDPKLWRAYAILGVTNNLIPFGLIAFGQTALPSGVAAILNASTPLWTVLLAHVATADERLTAPRLTGVLIGIAGVATIVGPQALHGAAGALLPSLAIVCAAVSYAGSAIFARRFKGQPPLITSAAQLSVSALVSVPALLLIEGLPATPSPHVLGALAGVGVLSTGIAFLLFFRILAGAGATNAVLVTFLVPVSAILLGALFLGEVLEPRDFVGMAAIALGLAAIDGRPLRRIRAWLA